LRRDLKALKAASVPWDTNSKRGYCHMIAYCRLRKGLRNFSMDGILKATDTGERFAPIAGFSLKDHLKGASGPNIGEAVQIEIVFDKDTARYARRRNWEFQHELRDEPDGSLRMTGIVRGLKDIQRELLSWGRHVEVIEPLELRNSIAEEARAMAAVYEAVEGRGLGD
jgi:predicted DNA-binding transcriptional regulator YafY